MCFDIMPHYLFDLRHGAWLILVVSFFRSATGSLCAQIWFGSLHLNIIQLYVYFIAWSDERWRANFTTFTNFSSVGRVGNVVKIISLVVSWFIGEKYKVLIVLVAFALQLFGCNALLMEVIVKTWWWLKLWRMQKLAENRLSVKLNNFIEAITFLNSGKPFHSSLTTMRLLTMKC